MGCRAYGRGPDNVACSVCTHNGTSGIWLTLWMPLGDWGPARACLGTYYEVHVGVVERHLPDPHGTCRAWNSEVHTV
jgi:hypothetical protein